jgi:hypothetical protein
MTDSPFPLRPGDTGTSWSVVQANDRATRYARTGRGRAVVLLHDDPASVADLVTRLAATHRVIAPELPRDPVHFATWFGDFLDGIGVAQSAVLASAPHAASAVATTLRDPDRFSHLALLLDGSDELEKADAILSEIRTGTQIPLLLLHATTEADAIADRLLEFFASTPADNA